MDPQQEQQEQNRTERPKCQLGVANKDEDLLETEDDRSTGASPICYLQPSHGPWSGNHQLAGRRSGQILAKCEDGKNVKMIDDAAGRQPDKCANYSNGEVDIPWGVEIKIGLQIILESSGSKSYF